MNLSDILNQVEHGKLSAEAAEKMLYEMTESNLGFARVDIDRLKRRGFSEIIFCPGKTGEQIVQIVTKLVEAKQDVFASRATREQYDIVHGTYQKAVYHDLPGIITLKVTKTRDPIGNVAIVCAGTSDIPVAEEAALAAEWMGTRTTRIYDIGVAGLHRLFKHLDELNSTRAIVVVAGMEGALPSVLGGLVDRPIIAVPTSVGYGANMKGIAALLAMLNSCVPGISVVNIDNGLGAGISAALINRVAEEKS